MEGQKALFLQYRLGGESLQELTRLLDEFEQSVGDSNSGRRTHTGARAELEVVTRELTRMLRQLDGRAVALPGAAGAAGGVSQRPEPGVAGHREGAARGGAGLGGVRRGWWLAPGSGGT